MIQLQGPNMIYALDEQGRNTVCGNPRSGFNTIEIPGDLWKIIYSVPGTERVESVIWQQNQKAEIVCGTEEITLRYNPLIGEESRVINACLMLRLKMSENGLQVYAELDNRDSGVILQELQLTPVSGARSLSGKHEEDYLAWPRNTGIRVPDPAYCDLSTYAGFRKYERHDQFHTDMDALYPGNQACMQWFDWYNEREGIYVGCEETDGSTVCLHAERDTGLNVLRLGFIRYPMIGEGETWSGAAVDIFPHQGDWHAGSRFYRGFMDRTGSFTAPVRPDWCRDMTGWLRVILKQHHCETNWDYSDIPALWDETEAAGFNTLYLLGWEKGGFARMWPDYVVDERMGGEKKLREGIEYVHSRGGKVIMFLSYALVDHQSDFYRLEGGSEVPIKSIWQEDIPFAETYCGEGTYRKIGNPPMPMYLACPGAPLWQEKMKWAAKQCLDLGADGVLYDIGGYTPYFCYDKTHTHSKPSRSHERKAANYAGLREYVKTFGEDRIILMEDNVDIFGKSMDVAHGLNSQPDERLQNPATAEDLSRAHMDSKLTEMYLYTFPELLVTNRECGEDENNYKAMAGYSFLLGLRFDMTIFRCCGSLKDIPAYTEYLKKLNALYHRFGKHLLQGRFRDTDGITWDNPYVYVKCWQAKDGTLAATLWNPTAHERKVTVTDVKTGKTASAVIPAEEASVIEL